MERKRILCPQTGHIELIDFEPTPLGALIVGCSRFLPRSSVDCSGGCAIRLDHRERRAQPLAAADADAPEDRKPPDR